MKICIKKENNALTTKVLHNITKQYFYIYSNILNTLHHGKHLTMLSIHTTASFRYLSTTQPVFASLPAMLWQCNWYCYWCYNKAMLPQLLLWTTEGDHWELATPLIMWLKTIQQDLKSEYSPWIKQLIKLTIDFSGNCSLRLVFSAARQKRRS